MTMSKEMKRLKSKLEFCDTLLYLYNCSINVFYSNKYDKMIEHYQNELTEVYKRIQDLKESNNDYE